MRLLQFSWWIRQLRTPFIELLDKVWSRITLVRYRNQLRKMAIRSGSYLHELPTKPLNQFIKPINNQQYKENCKILTLLSKLYLDHKFDLLGSGWVQVAYGMKCQGLEGYVYDDHKGIEDFDSNGEWLKSRINLSNLAEAKKIWQKVDSNYCPIDWQRDFKSGYRWKEATWHEDIAIPKNTPGADIKVPWEISRCQHLPQLGLASIFEKNKDLRNKYSREYRNQVLDFIANNPPGFGVNWHCTMDVAIRISNWLIAYDIFCSQGEKFDHDFEQIFYRSIKEHGKHILANIEWSNLGRSNHYLANIVGLILIAAYLPRDNHNDAQAAWAVKELVFEIREQFDEDGVNREGSTSYHRLSSELAIYGCIYASRLLLDRKENIFKKISNQEGLIGWGGRTKKAAQELSAELSNHLLPDDIWGKVSGMAEFIKNITRLDGLSPQIGDNDSGRFVKLTSRYDLNQCNGFPKENFLDHTHIVMLVSELMERDKLNSCSLEASIATSIWSFSPVKKIKSKESKFIKNNYQEFIDLYESLPTAHKQQYKFLVPNIHRGPLVTKSYKHFGAFIWRASNFFMVFRCGPNQQYGCGSHLHHDQLSIELMINEINYVRDPGTYVYTPLPNRRDEYRGIFAHFTPVPTDTRLIPKNDGLFLFPDCYRAECINFDNEMIIGRHNAFGDYVYRMIYLEDQKLVIKDFSEKLSLQRRSFLGNPKCFQGLDFSSGYGHK